MKAVYSEDAFSACTDCCLFDTCTFGDNCECDRYREEHDPDSVGFYYFVDEEGGDE